MSPDATGSDQDAERLLAGAIAAAVRRARLLALAEAFGWGLAAGAISPVAGALIAAGVVAWRWRSTSRASIVRLLERAHPDARNLFVTADELARETLEAKPAVRARVFADAAASAQRLDRAAALPIARIAWVTLLAAFSWSIVETAHLWRGGLSRAGADVLSRSTSPASAPAGTRLHVSVAIQPPAYTGLKETTVVDPEQLDAIEGSALVLSIDASATSVSVEHEGRARSLTRGAGGRFADRLQVTRPGFLALTTDDGARRMIPVVVSPDALPSVRLTAPGRDLVYSGGNPRICFHLHAACQRRIVVPLRIVNDQRQMFLTPQFYE